MVTLVGTARPKTGSSEDRGWLQLAFLAPLALLLAVVSSVVFVNPAGAAAETQAGTDSFTRANSAGWGSSEVGGAYSTAGTASMFRVTDNKGTINNLPPGSSAEAYLPGVAIVDTVVKAVLTVPSGALADLNVHSTLEARRQVDGSTYRGRVRLNAGGKVSVGVGRTTGKVEVAVGAAVNLPLVVSAGQDLNIEVQVSGSNPVVVKVRVSEVGAAVPEWQLTAVDSSAARIAIAGSVGIWDYVSGASVATTFVHDVFSATPVPPVALVYRAAGFDSLPLGAVNPADFNAALGVTNKNVAAYDDMTVVADNRGQGRILRTILKAGTIHASNGGDSGNNLFISLPASYDKACIQYDIRFDANFDWSLGGKLPGLEGVAPGVAPATPTGGNNTDLGWSGRGMWLGPKAYSWAGPTNMAVSYMYHPGQAGTYGDNVRWNKPYIAGTWHTVKQCHVMNTVGRADGVLRAWMDGSLVVNDEAYTYRTSDQVHINYIAFSLFRGGNTASWAGSWDGFVDIDNVLITDS